VGNFVLKKPVLIFPAGMPRALEFLDRAVGEGRDVIGASSLAHDPSRERYPIWVYLPYITASSFDDALKQAIVDFNIGGIYTPNPVVWDYLNRNLRELAPDILLINSSPIDAELSLYRKSLVFGQSIIDQPISLASVCEVKKGLPLIEIASLYRHAELIPGMCDHEKFRALYEISRCSPTGDIVEIGSWWGKSAFILARLANCFAIGKLMCVDPWSNEHLIQDDEKGLVDSIPVSADEALTVFQINLLPYANGNVNYLRMPSIEASRHYGNHPIVQTAEFGETTYSGRIAILHIDGNHSYANAHTDIVSWSNMVVPGGWIIIDDYIWPYGDGPQRVGDEFLTAHRERIDVAFLMGSALFIQLSY
jgi:Methyltransferase domain